MHKKGYLKNVIFCQAILVSFSNLRLGTKMENQKILDHVYRNQDRIIEKSIKIRHSIRLPMYFNMRYKRG